MVAAILKPPAPFKLRPSGLLIKIGGEDAAATAKGRRVLKTKTLHCKLVILVFSKIFAPVMLSKAKHLLFPFDYGFAALCHTAFPNDFGPSATSKMSTKIKVKKGETDAVT
ncbi:MAG TPA: hypothetical protein VGX94_08195 [Terriglobia bacterium]|nr:hypothetical protein [Terriglobia bacterium]